MSLLRISSRVPPLSAAIDSYFKEDVLWLHEKNRLAVWDFPVIAGTPSVQAALTSYTPPHALAGKGEPEKQ